MDAQGIMRVEGVGKVSLISSVDVTSRLKAEGYPGLITLDSEGTQGIVTFTSSLS